MYHIGDIRFFEFLKKSFYSGFSSNSEAGAWRDVSSLLMVVNGSRTKTYRICHLLSN